MTATFRAYVLKKALKLVSADRAEDHGDALENLTAIADLWTTHLRARYQVGFQLTPADVADLMELLKIARRMSHQGRANDDNYIDAAGYAALGYEMVRATWKKPRV